MKRPGTMRESSMSIRSISGSRRERTVLDDAPSLGDACRKQWIFIPCFPLLVLPVICKAIKEPCLLLGLGTNARPPTAEMCLILRAVTVPLPVQFPTF